MKLYDIKEYTKSNDVRGFFIKIKDLEVLDILSSLNATTGDGYPIEPER